MGGYRRILGEGGRGEGIGGLKFDLNITGYCLGGVRQMVVTNVRWSKASCASSSYGQGYILAIQDFPPFRCKSLLYFLPAINRSKCCMNTKRRSGTFAREFP